MTDWTSRGKRLAGLVEELRSFEDQGLEVRISVDDGAHSVPISLVAKVDGDVALLLNAERVPSVRAHRSATPAPTRRTPARAGVLVYALELEPMSRFYQRVLGGVVRHADDTHEVLQTEDTQLLLHRIPEPARAGIEVAAPPVPRSEQAIKPFFTVPSLDDAERLAVELGGRVLGEVYALPMMRVRNVCDPEGNILHLRELTE